MENVRVYHRIQLFYMDFCLGIKNIGQIVCRDKKYWKYIGGLSPPLDFFPNISLKYFHYISTILYSSPDTIVNTPHPRH